MKNKCEKKTGKSPPDTGWMIFLFSFYFKQGKIEHGETTGNE